MLRRALYFGLLLPLALGLARILSLAFPKLRAGFRDRVGIWKRLERMSARRDPERPLLWFHAASAGEFLQLEPLLRRAREQGVQLAVTVTSVSGLRWLERIAPWPETVWADLLPWDGTGTAKRLYDALRPSAVVFAQADLWPGLVWEGSRRSVPQLLLAARLNPRSGRARSWLLRWFYCDIYGRLTTILAATEDDLAALQRLVPGHPALRLGGDPGMETVLRRLDETRLPPYPAGTGGQPVLVAGSTWPPDETLLHSALRAVRDQVPGLRLILAPHEPVEARLAFLETLWGDAGTQRLTQFEASPSSKPPPVLLVDRVGRLAGLYRLGTLAYVGGAFTTGVHNVAEPAAAGLPVLFGPRYHNSAAARLLLDAGLASVVADAPGLEAALLPLLKSPERCASLGRQARARIESLASAAETCWEAVAACLPQLRAPR